MGNAGNAGGKVLGWPRHLAYPYPSFHLYVGRANEWAERGEIRADRANVTSAQGAESINTAMTVSTFIYCGEPAAGDCCGRAIAARLIRLEAELEMLWRTQVTGANQREPSLKLAARVSTVKSCAKWSRCLPSKFAPIQTTVVDVLEKQSADTLVNWDRGSIHIDGMTNAGSITGSVAVTNGWR